MNAWWLWAWPCAHSGQAAVGSAPLSSLPPFLGRYWELGERARAQPASKITPCSTRCLRVQPSGGRDKGHVMSHCSARKTRTTPRTMKACSLKGTRPLELPLRCTDICDGHVQMPFLNTSQHTLYLVCYMLQNVFHMHFKMCFWDAFHVHVSHNLKFNLRLVMNGFLCKKTKM